MQCSISGPLRAAGAAAAHHLPTFTALGLRSLRVLGALHCSTLHCMSLACTVRESWYLEDLEENDELDTQLMNDKSVCKIAVATPGLLIISTTPYLNSKL